MLGHTFLEQNEWLSNFWSMNPPVFSLPTTMPGAQCCLAGFDLVSALCVSTSCGFFPLWFGFHVVKTQLSRMRSSLSILRFARLQLYVGAGVRL